MHGFSLSCLEENLSSLSGGMDSGAGIRSSLHDRKGPWAPADPARLPSGSSWHHPLHQGEQCGMTLQESLDLPLTAPQSDFFHILSLAPRRNWMSLPHRPSALASMCRTSWFSPEARAPSWSCSAGCKRKHKPLLHQHTHTNHPLTTLRLPNLPFKGPSLLFSSVKCI